MKTSLRRMFALAGTAAAGWIVGYAVADAPTITDADKGVAATHDTVPFASKANDRDDEATAFRTAIASAFQEPRPLARRRRFVEAIASAPIEALPAAVKMLLLLDDEEASEYTGLLFARWTELDPVQAAQRAVSFSDDYRLDGALDVVMEVWVATAPAAAEQWVRGLRNGTAAIRAVEAFISNVAATDPRRALRLMHEMSSSDGKRPVLDTDSSAFLYRQVFSELSDHDGKSAVKEALSLPVGAARAAAIEGALISWGAHDFRTAFSIAATLPDTVARQRNVESLLTYRTDVEPGQLAACIMELPAGPLRIAALRKAMDTIPKRDPALAQRLIAEMPPGGFSEQMQHAVANALGEKDPEAAAAFLATLPRGENDDSYFANLGRSWAGSDPEAALAWAWNVPAGKLQKAAIQGALNTWANEEPAAAATWASANLSDEDAAKVLDQMCEEWSRTDAKAALDWSLALPAGASRNAAITSVLGPLAALDPDRATAIFAKLPEDARYNAASSITYQWADRDAPAAANWALTLTEESGRSSALSDVIRHWATDDEPAAEAWLRALPPGAARDDAAEKFAGNPSPENLPRAGSLVMLISDAKQREETASALAEQWLKEDEAAALIWLKTTPALSPYARDQLLRKHDSDRR